MIRKVTPLDIQSFASQKHVRRGEQLFENGLVKNRFSSQNGLKAIVRSRRTCRVEIFLQDDKLTGHCSCHLENTSCEHQAAVLMAWVHEPESFITFPDLRKALRHRDKTILINILMQLCESFPELSHHFMCGDGKDEIDSIREEVADIFDLPFATKIDPIDIVSSFQTLSIRAKLYCSEYSFQKARTIYFELLNRSLSLIDSDQLSEAFPPMVLSDIAEEYEQSALQELEHSGNRKEIQDQVKELLGHDAAGSEGVVFPKLVKKLEM